MTCQISIGPEDTFILTTPSGRTLSLPNSPHAVNLLWRILWDASSEKPSSRLVGGFPTQAIVNRWVDEVMPERRAEEEAERAEERRKALEAKTGIALTELDFNL